ncbi:MAG TPA: hypothetical protein EYQ86_09565 [Bacteroidetes bacterium]|nr:hypothetical protein [Bacteroidota bacterium]
MEISPVPVFISPITTLSNTSEGPRKGSSLSRYGDGDFFVVSSLPVIFAPNEGGGPGLLSVITKPLVSELRRTVSAQHHKTLSG